MGTPSFRFRQFTVRHDRCAQKVGTDGVLLGAWAGVGDCRRLLDIGTGTGLIALMAAQRCPQAQVTALEIDPEAVAQARENVLQSPFAQRIRVVQADVRDYHSPVPFDGILCNPPFFTEDTLPDNPSRALARHSALLSFADLIASASRLLAPEGAFHVILPSNSANDFEHQCFIAGLNCVRRCLVRTVAHKPPKRLLLTFSRQGTPCLTPEELVLQDGPAPRSSAYAHLTRDFYL